MILKILDLQNSSGVQLCYLTTEIWGLREISQKLEVFFQKTPVQVLALTSSGSQPPVITTPGCVMPSSGLYRYSHAHTHMCKYTQK